VIVTEDPFDRLLDAMPKIAQVVNEFRSEEVQRRAFEALLATLSLIGNSARCQHHRRSAA